MAVEKGTAKHYLDLLFRLREFLTGLKLIEAGDITYPGGSDAVLVNPRLTASAVEETISLTCSDAGGSKTVHSVTITNNDFSSEDLTGWTPGVAGGAVKQVSELGTAWVAYGEAVAECDFSQTLSIPGAAETDVDAGDGLFRLSWKQSSANGLDIAWVEINFIDATETSLEVVTSRKEAGFPLTLDDHTLNVKIPATARQVILTVHLKSYTANPTNTESYLTEFIADVVTLPVAFSLSGSISGALGTVYEDEDYDGNEMSFHLDPGTAGFSLSDVISFSAVVNELTTQSTDQSWTVDNNDSEWNGRQYFHGTGLAGTDNIHINVLNSISKNSDYYNLGFQGAIDYNDVEHLNFDNQPGVSGHTYMQCWNNSIPYWFIADGRRFMIAAKISTTYQTGYFGLFLPYATPGQYPLPLFVAAADDTAGRRWSDENGDHRGCFTPNGNAARIRKVDGSWFSIQNNTGGTPTTHTGNNVHPWNEANGFLRNNIDGTYTLIEARLRGNDAGGNVLGVLDGLYWVSGFGNAAENIITVGGVDHIVIQNIFRTGFNDYCAMRLE